MSYDGGDVTVIIPTYNREAGIRELLEQLLAQTERPARIVVSDDRSTDETCAVVSGYDDRRVLLVQAERNTGPGGARNRGLAHAKSELVCFLDSDVRVPDDRFLEHMLAFLDAHPDAAAIEAQQSYPRSGPFFQQLVHLVPGMAGNTDQLKNAAGRTIPFASTTASLWRREKVLAYGAFDERRRTGEDSELSWKAQQAGERFYLANATIEQDYRATLGSFLRQQYWYGVGGGALVREHPRFLNGKQWLALALLIYVPLSIAAGIAWWPLFVLVLAPMALYLPWSTRVASRRPLHALCLLPLQYAKHVANSVGILIGWTRGTRAFRRRER